MSMIRCSKCRKFFPEELLDGTDGEKWCIHCDQPYQEFPDEFQGLDEEPPAWLHLMSKMALRATRFEVTLPMLGQPENHYVEATVYEGEGRYWYIEGRAGKYKDKEAALREVCVTADMKRHKLLNEAFEKEFG